MRAAIALLLLATACGSDPAAECDAGDAATPPDELFLPDPACTPLSAEEVEAMETPCDDPYRCTYLYPWHITVVEDRNVAYLDYLSDRSFLPYHDGTDCPAALRYRLDLTDGTIGLIGHRCVTEADKDRLLAAMERRGIEVLHLCAISNRLGLEVRALQARVPWILLDREILGLVFGASWRPAVYVRDQATGAIRFERRVVQPHVHTLPSFERHVWSTADPTACCDREFDIGCGVQCGGDMDTIPACTGRARVVAEDGFCHEHPIP